MNPPGNCAILFRMGEKNGVSNALLEQYKLAVTCLDSEITRFWTRFNILMGVQVGALVGVYASVPVLSANPMLFRILLILMVLFSASTAVINHRGSRFRQQLIGMVAAIESQSEGKLMLFTTASTTLPKSRGSVSAGIQEVAVWISIVSALAWVASLLWSEAMKYSFTIPE